MNVLMLGVAKQLVPPHTRDEQYGEAVVVEVGDGDADAVELDIEAVARATSVKVRPLANCSL